MTPSSTFFRSIIFLLLAILLTSSKEAIAQYTPNDYFERGKKMHKQGDLAKAIEYYSYALSLEANCVKCYYNRGMAFMATEKYHKSRSDFDKVLKIDPADTDAYEQRGSLHYLLGNYEAAISDYNFVIQVRPEASMYINRGMAHLEHSNYNSALRDLETAVRLEKNDPETYRIIGDVYFAKNDLETAIEYYGMALEIDPNNEQTLNNRGNTYHEMGLEALALQDYDHAISVYKNSYTYTNRANYWLKQGEYEKSLADCKKATQLDYNNAEAYYCVGLVENAKGNATVSLENFNKAIAIQNNRADFYNGRGLALFQLKEYGDALEDFEQAVTIDPSDAAARDRILDCRQNLGNSAIAQETSEEWEDWGDEETIEEDDTKYEIATASFSNDDLPEEFTARGITNYDFTAKAPAKPVMNRDIDVTTIDASEDFGASQIYENEMTNNKHSNTSSDQLKSEKYLELAEFYFKTNDYKEALQHYESALWHNKEAAIIHWKKAQCLIALEQNEDALLALDKYLTLSPSDVEVIYERGTLRLRTGNIFGAKEDYDKGLSLDSKHTKLLLSRAQWNAHKKYYIKAIEDYNALIQLDPQANSYYQRGLMWFELKTYNKAINDFTAAILDSDIEKHEYYFARGLAYQFSKTTESALYDFDKTISISPRFAKAYMYRAAIKSSMGDKDGTCSDYRKAVSLGYKVKDKINFVSHCK